MTEAIQTNPFAILEDQIKQLANKIDSLIEKKSELPKEDIFSVLDTYKKLGVSRPTLHAWTKEGKIKSVSIGGRVFYTQSAINEALKPRRYTTH